MFESVGAVVGVDPAVLAAVLFAVTDEDIAALTVGQAEALTLAAERVMAAVAARQRSAIETVARRCEERCEREAADAAAAGRRPLHLSGDQLAAGSLAPLLHVSPRTMVTRVDRARRVVCSLPGVQALAWSGALEAYRVDAVVGESLAAPTDRLHEFEARVLEGGITGLPCAALRARARRCADRCAPLEAGQACEQARTRREVRVRPGECSGMTRLVADLPTSTALRLWGAVDALAAEYARAQPGLLMGAARADALADLVEANATISTSIELVTPVQAHAPGSLRVFRPAASTDCLAPDPSDPAAASSADPATTDPAAGDTSAADTATAAPAGWFVDVGGCQELDDGILHDHDGELWFVSAHTEVPSLGSLLPADVVALLSDPDTAVRVAGSDPATGAVRWQDPDTYRPGARTARAVRSRDGTCRFPGCATAARRCQLDHVIRHPDGPTQVTNLQTLCATHHAFKHHAGWRVQMDPHGICTWTAPDGRTHTTWPADRHSYPRAA
ncbi:HNH endonuclease signature motif containing protein, partial [Pedococcus sp.]|uniref:HNH endonuclease signature motif containing protein n=1 Tax=Pedococcus sp. TaxID=2860345 RepID=UPI002E115C42|nr:HNH endonuclease signature motif containing protein [Pedococcus sp.]